MSPALVLICTVGALVAVGYETGFLFTVIFGGIGLLIGLATLPWQQRKSGMSETEYLCMWTMFWFYLVFYLLAEGLRIYARHWSDFMARRRYERSQVKKQ